MKGEEEREEKRREENKKEGICYIASCLMK
jgi:hypothetical protein